MSRRRCWSTTHGKPLCRIRLMNIRPVILLLALVSSVGVACSAPPTPSEEAIAVLKQYLQDKTYIRTSPIFLGSSSDPAFSRREIECWTTMKGDDMHWFADYDSKAHRWDITGTGGPYDNPNTYLAWSLDERTKHIISTGSGSLHVWC